MRGRKGEPGTHCMRMRQISQEFHGIVNFPYKSVNDDAINCFVSRFISVAVSIVAHYQVNGEFNPRLVTIPKSIAIVRMHRYYSCQVSESQTRTESDFCVPHQK